MDSDSGGQKPSSASNKSVPRREPVACRRRKTKCTGTHPCEICCLESSECIYVPGPARTRRSTQRASKSSPPIDSSHDPRSDASRSGQTPNGTASSESPWEGPACEDNSQELASSVISYGRAPVRWTFQNAHPTGESELNPIPSASSFDINKWDVQSKLVEVQRMRIMVRTYLAKANPRIPCLNSRQLNGDVEALLEGQGDMGQNKLQTVALVDLVMALEQIMTDDTACSSSIPPGWREFKHAERLLRDTAWKGIWNVKSVQCLTLKAMYLLYIDRWDLAYDVTGSVVRICFQLGLHNQASWSSCSPFEIHLRQRIVWTVFCLQHHIADACGLPYQLHLSDLDVALPPHVDDMKLHAGLNALPADNPEAPIAPLDVAYRHFALLAEAWDRVLTAKTANLPDPDTVAGIDAQIELLLQEIRGPLQWRSDLGGVCIHARSQFHVRQGLLIHLLLNSLRLLLRRGWVHSLDICPGVLNLCVEIATDSISSIHEYYSTDLPQPLERHASARFLLGSIHVLSHIALHKPWLVQSTVRQATASFDQGISLLKEFACRLPLARTSLHQLRDTIVAISGKRNECLSTRSVHQDDGSKGNGFAWLDFLNLESLQEPHGSTEEVVSMKSDSSDAYTQPFIHTEGWLAG